MKVTVVENYNEMSKAVADIIYRAVSENPSATLGLATGSTPLGCYRLLAEFCAAKKLSFARVKTVNLDEYVGLDPSDSNSYAYFMRHNLFDAIDVELSNTHIPDGAVEDVNGECERYSQLLTRIPRDVQILGLGANGHIGFNEPYTPFDSRTHEVTLAASTVRDNARHFNSIDDVPTRAITMGIAEIMQAKKIILLANGEAKAQAVRDAVKGEISEACPASILQRHPDCTVIVDKSAAKLIRPNAR